MADELIGFDLLRVADDDAAEHWYAADQAKKLKKERAQRAGYRFCEVCDKKHHPCLATPMLKRRYLQCATCLAVYQVFIF